MLPAATTNPYGSGRLVRPCLDPPGTNRLKALSVNGSRQCRGLALYASFIVFNPRRLKAPQMGRAPTQRMLVYAEIFIFFFFSASSSLSVT